jgi:hypothetical protein
MALGSDGKVKPVGATGIQENMVIGDIYLQLGFALRNGIETGAVDMGKYMSERTQMSATSMQTSLGSIYAGSSARMVGISGTVAGLQQLIINRTGSGKIYNITGERVDPNMFNGVMEVNATNPTGDLTGKITEIIRGIKAGDRGIEALENVLMLGKTQGTIESFRGAVQEAIKEIGGYEELKLASGEKIEIYEFTDKQGRWTDAEGNVSRDLGRGMKSISDVAKNKGIRRIIIANEMGATGVDYQGNYLNVVGDAHIMSNTDLAQALKGQRGQMHRLVRKGD